MPDIIDNIDFDRDQYPHKLEFRRRWMKIAVISLATMGVMYWVQLIASIFINVYYLISK